MPYTTKSGANIYYEVVGDKSKPILLMNHGLGNSVANWYSLGYVEQLKDHFCLVMYDGRGFGKSQKFYNVIDYHPEKLVADLKAVLDEERIEKCHFFGNSRGAFIGFSVAKYLPERFDQFVLGGVSPHGKVPAIPEFVDLIEEGMVKGGEYFVKQIEGWVGRAFPSTAGIEYAQNNLKAMLAATEAQGVVYDYSTSFQKNVQGCHFFVGRQDPYWKELTEFCLGTSFSCEVFNDCDHARGYWDSALVAPFMIRSLIT